MNLSRRKRIVLEFLGPLLLGGGLATLWAWGRLLANQIVSPLDAVERLGALPAMWLLYGLFAFPAIGLQAACYTAIMEWRFCRGLSPRSGRAVALSTALGYLAGLPLAIGYGFHRQDTWWFFSVTGPLVGLILGLLIRCWSPKRSSPA